MPCPGITLPIEAGLHSNQVCGRLTWPDRTGHQCSETRIIAPNSSIGAGPWHQALAMASKRWRSPTSRLPGRSGNWIAHFDFLHRRLERSAIRNGFRHHPCGNGGNEGGADDHDAPVVLTGREVSNQDPDAPLPRQWVLTRICRQDDTGLLGHHRRPHAQKYPRWLMNTQSGRFWNRCPG